MIDFPKSFELTLPKIKPSRDAPLCVAHAAEQIFAYYNGGVRFNTWWLYDECRTYLKSYSLREPGVKIANVLRHAQDIGLVTDKNSSIWTDRPKDENDIENWKIKGSVLVHHDRIKERLAMGDPILTGSRMPREWHHSNVWAIPELFVFTADHAFNIVGWTEQDHWVIQGPHYGRRIMTHEAYARYGRAAYMVIPYNRIPYVPRPGLWARIKGIYIKVERKKK